MKKTRERIKRAEKDPRYIWDNTTHIFRLRKKPHADTDTSEKKALPFSELHYCGCGRTVCAEHSKEPPADTCGKWHHGMRIMHDIDDVMRDMQTAKQAPGFTKREITREYYTKDECDDHHDWLLERIDAMEKREHEFKKDILGLLKRFL